MFYFPGAKIWNRFVNDCSVGLALKDNVRHDNFRFFVLLQIEVTLELYLSPFFHKGKNMEELATNTEVSKGDLENYNYQWHTIIYILYRRIRHWSWEIIAVSFELRNVKISSPG